MNFQRELFIMEIPPRKTFTKILLYQVPLNDRLAGRVDLHVHFNPQPCYNLANSPE